MARSYYFSALKINPTNIRALYGVILSSTNVNTKSSSSNRSNETAQQSAEQVQWAKDVLFQKYREQLPDLVPLVESAIKSLTF